MTVKELREVLSNYNDDDLVVVSKDDEGNSYSLLEDVDECSYVAESSYNGYIGIRELTDEHIKAGYTEEDLIEDGVNAIVLYPIN